MNEDFYTQACQAFGKDAVRLMEPMRKHTTFRTGGNADYFLEPANIEEWKEAVQLCEAFHIPYIVIGNGSNLLVGDKGFSGMVLHMGKSMDGITIKENHIYAQAGAYLSVIAKKAAEQSLSGMEFASGIPGSLGGAVYMNAGAYDGEMRLIVKNVTVLRPDGLIRVLSGNDMQFAYRSSLAVKEGFYILEAELELTSGEGKQILKKMEEYAARRKEKQPLEYPSAGSTFKRPEGFYAGKLIMEAGLSGYKIGGAMVSPKHCGFIINTGTATAKDIRSLIEYIQEKVKEQFQVVLEPEVKLIGEF